MTKTGHVLLVEDSLSDQLIAKYAIEKFNPDISVDVAGDGHEAIQKLDAYSELPDLVLVDINMPRMNGIELLDKLESQETPPQVVMLTSSNNPADRDACMAHSFVKDYMLKPLSIELFAKMVSDRIH